MPDIKAKISQSGLLKGSTTTQNEIVASKAEVNFPINLGDLTDVTVTNPNPPSGSFIIFNSTTNTYTDDQTIVKTGTGITLTGELVATSLDISGDVDVDGTLEADAITVNGITLAETISDTVGNMITDSNTESGIAVTYDDSDNTLDFNVDDFSITLTGDVAGSGTVTNLGDVSFATTIQAGSLENDMLAGSIANAKLSNSTVSYGGISLALGANDDTPAFNLQDATGYPTSSLVGTISNSQLAGSITNDKLSNSSITVSDGSNTSPVALGGTLTFAGTSNEVTVAESSGTVTIGLPDDIAISGELEGGSLDINGNADISGNLTGVDDFTASGQIQGGSINVYNTDTDANSDPQLDLYRNSPSPTSGDSLGIINFYGENDQSTKTQYAAITGKIASAGDSGESGKISFTVASEGSWNNDALVVAQDGVTINGVGGQDQKLRANVPITTTSSITAPTYTFPGLPTNEVLSIGSSVDNDAVKMRFRIGDPNDNGFGGGTTATRDGWIWEGNYSNFGGYQTLMSLTVDNQPATLSVQGNITATGDIGALSFTTTGDNNFISTGEMNVGNSDGTINVRGALANNAPQLSIKTVGADTRIQEHNSGNIDFPSTTLSVPTAPTAGAHVTNKTYVDAQVAGIVDGAPGTLNTLNEIAIALNNDAALNTTLTNSIGGKLTIASNLI